MKSQKRREEENPPLTETAKAQFTSSIHGNVRSITDLPSRLGAPPTRDSSQFEFGAEVLQSPRAPAAAPSQSPQKLPPRQPKPKMRRQVSFDAAHASRDDAVQMRESNEEEPLDESVADESLERSLRLFLEGPSRRTTPASFCASLLMMRRTRRSSTRGPCRGRRRRARRPGLH